MSSAVNLMYKSLDFFFFCFFSCLSFFMNNPNNTPKPPLVMKYLLTFLLLSFSLKFNEQSNILTICLLKDSCLTIRLRSNSNPYNFKNLLILSCTNRVEDIVSHTFTRASCSSSVSIFLLLQEFKIARSRSRPLRVTLNLTLQSLSHEDKIENSISADYRQFSLLGLPFSSRSRRTSIKLSQCMSLFAIYCCLNSRRFSMKERHLYIYYLWSTSLSSSCTINLIMKFHISFYIYTVKSITYQDVY